MGGVSDIELIYSLVGYPDETEWIEFKESNPDPERIGKDISALANSAAYHDREFAYRLWGVEDKSHDLLGTTFDPLAIKAKGNQDLQIWLSRMLSQNANYEFRTIDSDEGHFIVLVIRAASEQPVYFENRAYIREGSSTTSLKTGSAKEAELWRRLQKTNFEQRVAEMNLLPGDIFDLLDIETFFSALDLRRPSTDEGVLQSLIEQCLVKAQDNGRYSITNLGALLIAKKLSSFSGMRKRTLRIIKFAGTGNLDILDDKYFDEGYAKAIPDAQSYLMSVIPAEEHAVGAFRKLIYAYPPVAIRELLSNVVIHQDLSDTSSGPTVCLYENRIVFANPGESLIPADRVLNALPKTRNDGLSNLLRQMDLCEEGGTGWDRAVEACEQQRMMAPQFRSDGASGTTVTLFSGTGFDRMTKQERVDATYWHACLLYARGESMSNQTLRERFGLGSEKKDLVAISRLIRECCNSGRIKEEDANVGTKYRRYIPAWA